MSTIRLTMAQAVARFLTAQKTEIDGKILPLFGGVWAIFGHGNVAGMGEALHGVRETLPTFRAHNEQGMAHAAVAFAKASRRRRMMACTTSIGPGATNMVTAAAVAHVNRLPVLLLPGDVFANRRPDPVLQQIESFSDGTVSANDCFRPVSRYFDRITRPEQIIPALQRAMTVLTDPAECGPVTLALCQDTQAEAYDYPESFFAEKIWTPRRIRPDETELAEAVELIRNAKKPFIVAGGGVLYSGAEKALAEFAHALPETANLEIDVAFMGSLTALREYAAGRAGLAGFHVALSRSGASDRRPFLEWLSPRRDRLIRFVDRDQGLILPRGNPRRLRRLGDIAAKRLRFVNRQRGSGTRLLIDQMLATERIDPANLDGYAKEEFTHAAIAATVASGGADAGFGLSAAAAEYGLAFVPLTRERYFLAVRARAVESAGVKRLLAGLRDAAFTRLVHGLPGYSSAAAGTVVEVDALSASV